MRLDLITHKTLVYQVISVSTYEHFAVGATHGVGIILIYIIFRSDFGNTIIYMTRW